MKALHTIGKKIQRFCYPLYFYPNQLKAKLSRTAHELSLENAEMPTVQKAY